MPSFKLPITLLCSALALQAPLTLAADATLQLYMDMETKQLFAEPGPGRVLMGTFKPVDESSEGATQSASSLATTTPERPDAETADDLPVIALKEIKELDERLDRSEEQIARLVDRNAGIQHRDSWSDNFQIRGYIQNRYTFMTGGDEGVDLWSDRSVGDRYSNSGDNNFLIRRARLVFYGDMGDRLSFYIQPDLASSAGSTGHVMQMRDAYADVYLTTDREHRFRIGQSKVPYGFENLQSSQNRLALDRHDALNSAVRDERDLGIFYYYTPSHVQSRFKRISAQGLKHSGNYGMFGLGVYNGQGANRQDRNNEVHTVARLSYPFELDNGQFLEIGLQGYTGNYVPSTGAYTRADGNSAVALLPEQDRLGLKDERIGASFMLYPQPFGLQAEWNWGTTPALNLADNRIETRSLNGGYVQAIYMSDPTAWGTFLPFLKWQYFDGANKAELNAPVNKVNDIELGLEWQFNKELELALVYHRMHRNNLVTGNRAGREDYDRFRANALRMQFQYNY